MSLDLGKNYYLAEGVEQLQKEDKVLFINYETTDWFRTNIEGAWIIERCNGAESLYSIIQSKAEEEGFDVDGLIKVVTPFLEKCIDRSILVEEKPQKPQELVAEMNVDYPRNIWIHVSDKCNLACPFCYTNSTGAGNQFVDTDKVLRFLEEVPKENREGIVISGGEPFLFPDLVKLVKGIHTLEYQHVVIITNGTVGEEKYADVIPCINTLQISLDGSTAEIHDITRGHGSFDKVCKKFELAKKYNVETLLCSITPTKFNVEDIPNLPWFAYHQGLDALHITRLMPTGRGRENKDAIYPDIEIYNKSFRKFLENVNDVNRQVYFSRSNSKIFKEESGRQKYLELTVAADQSKKVILGSRRISCGLGTLVSIGYDSKIYPCPSLSFPEYQLGDLDNSVDEIMAKANAFANKYSVNSCNEECKTCKLKYFCGGGCRACTYGLGDICSKDPSCDYYKESITDILWNYIPRDENEQDV